MEILFAGSVPPNADSVNILKRVPMKIYNRQNRLLLLTMALLYTSLLPAAPGDLAEADGELAPEQLVAAVLQANPRVEIALAAWQAASARIDQQSTLHAPRFSYGFAPMTIGSRAADFGQRVELSQQLPWPAKLELRGKKAGYEARTQEQTLLSMQLLLATTAKSLFADWYYIHRAIAINHVNQKLLQDFHAIALTRYRTGQTSKQDVLRAEMELTLLQHQDITLKRQRKTIQARINTLLNQAPEQALPAPQQLPLVTDIPDPAQLQLTALQNRQELKAAKARIAAHKTQQKLAELAFIPDLKVSAGYNSLWDNRDKRFNIDIPLDRSRLQAALQEARANARRAHWQEIDLQASIREELQISYDRVQESLHVLQLYRQQITDLADANLAAAVADYRAGKGDFLTLISSEKNRMQTQLQTEQALAELHRRLAGLEQAVGSIQSFTAQQH